MYAVYAFAKAKPEIQKSIVDDVLLDFVEHLK